MSVYLQELVDVAGICRTALIQGGTHNRFDSLHVGFMYSISAFRMMSFPLQIHLHYCIPIKKENNYRWSLSTDVWTFQVFGCSLPQTVKYEEELVRDPHPVPQLDDTLPPVLTLVKKHRNRESTVKQTASSMKMSLSETPPPSPSAG